MSSSAGESFARSGVRRSIRVIGCDSDGFVFAFHPPEQHSLRSRHLNFYGIPLVFVLRAATQTLVWCSTSSCFSLCSAGRRCWCGHHLHLGVYGSTQVMLLSERASRASMIAVLTARRLGTCNNSYIHARKWPVQRPRPPSPRQSPGWLRRPTL